MATSQVETVSTGADKAKLGAAVALVVGGGGGLLPARQAGHDRAVGRRCWRAWCAAVVVFVTSEPGKEFVAFGREPGAK